MTVTRFAVRIGEVQIYLGRADKELDKISDRLRPLLSASAGLFMKFIYHSDSAHATQTIMSSTALDWSEQEAGSEGLRFISLLLTVFSASFCFLFYIQQNRIMSSASADPFSRESPPFAQATMFLYQ